MEIKDRRPPKGIDLFAGAGGLSLGFENAGFDIVYALEVDKYAAETYKHNRNHGTVVDVVNILDTKPEEILKKIKLSKGDLDIVLGGPPCQGFSIANMRTRNNGNPLNWLVYNFLESVRGLMPKWFVMENVAGLEKFGNGKLKDELLDLFEESGYYTKSVVLNAACFGIPQIRRRIFFIGNRVNKPLDFLDNLVKSTSLPYVTVREAIDDLPILENGNSMNRKPYTKNGKDLSHYQRNMRLGNGREVSNNLVSMSTELAVERYKYIEQGQNWRAIAQKKTELLYNYKDLSKCHQWIYLRLCWDKPSVVISNYRKNMLIHPGQDRGLSVREAARLQSFPDNYIFYGPLGYQQQQVANAVPPLVANNIAGYIRELLNT